MSKTAKKISAEKAYDIIRRPIITEKAAGFAGGDEAPKNAQVTFEVSLCATKPEIRAAVEQLFSVKVQKVNTLILKGKTKLFRGMKGRRSDMKKAIVTLAEGQQIDVSTGL